MTPLQANVRALADLLSGAREDLPPDAYSWFIAVACELFGHEAARLFVGEALRATGDRRDAA